MEKRYNVTIRDNKASEIQATIGKALILKRAEKRQLTGLGRIDRENFYISIDEIKEPENLEPEETEE